jgi:hypothetical protein
LQSLDEIRARAHLGTRETVHVVTVDDCLERRNELSLLVRIAIRTGILEGHDPLELTVEHALETNVLVRARRPPRREHGLALKSHLDQTPDRMLLAPTHSESAGIELSAHRAFSPALEGWAIYAWSHVVDDFNHTSILRS